MYNFGIKQAHTGYRIAYRQAEQNYCPGCGRTHWIIGRMTAECAFCSTALPLVTGGTQGVGILRSRGDSNLAPPLAA